VITSPVEEKARQVTYFGLSRASKMPVLRESVKLAPEIAGKHGEAKDNAPIDDRDLDDLLAEIEGVPAPNKKAKRKKKGGDR